MRQWTSRPAVGPGGGGVDRRGCVDRRGGVGSRGGVQGGEGVDRLQHFIALFEKVPGQRTVGLLPIPRTLDTQSVDQLIQGKELGAHRWEQLRDPQRCEVIGVKRPIELVPGDVPNVFVGQSEMEENRHLLGHRGLHGQLDIGQQILVPALRHQQRPTLAGRLYREGLAVHQSEPSRYRVHSEAHQGEVDERHRRVHHQVDLAANHGRVLSQQCDRPFGDGG